MALTGGQRSGYLHALEGTLAALIVTFYLTSLVSVPSETDWTDTRISKQAADSMQALDRAGILDRAVLRQDPGTVNAMLSAMDRSLLYSIRISDIPPPQLMVGVAANESTTFQSDTSTTAQPAGAPDGYRWRDGTIRGVDFVLTDTTDDKPITYDWVNFDFDDDDVYDDGPYEFGDRFVCPGGAGGCNGASHEVGPFNDTLTLYHANTTARLAEALADTQVGGRPVTFDVQTFNDSLERIVKFDAVVAHAVPTDQVGQQRDRFEPLLDQGGAVLVTANLSGTDAGALDLDRLGFEYISEYRVIGGGDNTTTLSDTHTAGTAAYTTSSYYQNTDLRTASFTDAGGYDTGELVIRGEPVTARVYDSDTVAFGTESFALNYSTGDRVNLRANTYLIQSITPLELQPTDTHRFTGFNTPRIAGDYHLTERVHHTFNTTLYDRTAPHDTNTTSRPPGVAETPCDETAYPYRLGNVTIESGDTYDFAMVNVDYEGAHERGECNDYYEYVYFDIDDDGQFDGEEGPYQRDEIVELGDGNYTVRPFLNGTGTHLLLDGPRTVGEFPVSRDVVSGSGSVGLLGKTDLGHDDMSLMRAVLMAESQHRFWFTDPRSVGDDAYGYTYLSDVTNEPLQSYTAHTVWWYE